MSKLSPQAQAVWEAFNEDEAGVFVDYGEKIAAALRAAALYCKQDRIRLLAIAEELENLNRL
jgi:hypothetical protein